MDRRDMIGAGLAGLVAASVASGPATVEAASAQPDPPVTRDRNGNLLAVGQFVNVPCFITSITPSLNPATTAVGIRTFPNGLSGYGLDLIVYPSQVLMP